MIITSLCLFAAASAKPLQVIIMAGQSNMVGHGYAEGSNLHWNATVGYVVYLYVRVLQVIHLAQSLQSLVATIINKKLTVKGR